MQDSAYSAGCETKLPILGHPAYVHQAFMAYILWYVDNMELISKHISFL